MKLVFAFLFVACIGICHGAIAADKIVNLPGLPPVNFAQYSGYFNVDESHGRRLFYWFVESQGNPTKDPLVLWLNGGPGCSSLAGLFEENGPFTPNSDGTTLSINPYSWNKKANVIYIESPAGVGFSYSDTKSDYTVGDLRTSQDLYRALQLFFEGFPEYFLRPLWVSGESYGGHYVPNLALYIHQQNQAEAGIPINLSGFLVGNPWTDTALDNEGAAFFWWSHALISDEIYGGMKAFCNFSSFGPLKENNPMCEHFCDEAWRQMGNIDIYQIYADVCLTASESARQLLRYLAGTNTLLGHFAMRAVQEPNPCVDGYLVSYLNRPDVQAAIHANVNYAWTGCSSIIDYSYPDLLTSMLPVYKELFKANIRMLVYSGDIDGIVPVTGTRAWIAALDRKTTESWRSWTASDGQVAGYVQRYEGLTFATVRGAGHLVPAVQPLRAFDMFERWISDRPL